MAQERLTMRKIREVLRLKRECGLSNRAIARSCSISHSTVGEYVRRAEEAGLSWPLPEDVDEDRLFELLFPKPPAPGSRSIPCPDWSWVHAELRKKSITLRLLWVEYREEHPTGYGYSQFCALYRKWAKRLNPSMRLTHKAGEKVFVDYAGQTVPIVDPDSGGNPDTHRPDPVPAKGGRAGHRAPPGEVDRALRTSSYNRFVMVGHPRDTIPAPGRDRWAVLVLLVAPSGDFWGKTVAHAEWHFQLACCSRAAEGSCQSSNSTRLLLCSVPWDTHLLSPGDI
ncbi:MAG TPA: winged helix-turn-helix transcriptional regulator, partial [Chloroflexi bacterium]|nr:winged helix-turn-helix transcriptional regulator [Chloroflexota bacterium]